MGVTSSSSPTLKRTLNILRKPVAIPNPIPGTLPKAKRTITNNRLQNLSSDIFQTMIALPSTLPKARRTSGKTKTQAKISNQALVIMFNERFTKFKKIIAKLPHDEQINEINKKLEIILKRIESPFYKADNRTFSIPKLMKKELKELKRTLMKK